MPARGDREAATESDDVREIAARVEKEISESLDPEFLLPFIHMLRSVATTSGRLHRRDLEASEETGRRAALSGVPLASLVDGYLSAGRVVWVGSMGSAPTSASSQADLVARGEAIFRASDAALAAVARGFGRARLGVVQREESDRREFVDDLLAGSADTASIVARADRFGLVITAPHTVAVARRVDGGAEVAPPLAHLEQRLRSLLPDRDLLVTTKDSDVVLVFGERASGARASSSDRRLMSSALRAIRRVTPESEMRLSIGPMLDGPGGVAESYRAASQGADLSVRLGWTDPIVWPERMAVYAVLLRDRHALVDLVESVLAPLTSARGGAGPLLETLVAYLASGGVATEAARRMSLSVRAVTYRLARIKQLTGWDPMDPAHWLTLQVAAEGARLLDWPEIRS